MDAAETHQHFPHLLWPPDSLITQHSSFMSALWPLKSSRADAIKSQTCGWKALPGAYSLSLAAWYTRIFSRREAGPRPLQETRSHHPRGAWKETKSLNTFENESAEWINIFELAVQGYSFSRNLWHISTFFSLSSKSSCIWNLKKRSNFTFSQKVASLWSNRYLGLHVLYCLFRRLYFYSTLSQSWCEDWNVSVWSKTHNWAAY